MIKLESLKKNDHFKLALKEKKTHTDFFSIFAAKNFIPTKNKNLLYISFVMKKKIGNAVKRNKIRRKLKAIVHKVLKIKGAINTHYTYIVFGKSKAYETISYHIPFWPRPKEIISPFVGGGSLEVRWAHELGIRIKGYDVFNVLVN